jgi:glycosyltransferase involved in cell wall biosynthesis
MDKDIKQALVSVLMPVYNAQKYMREAIESILDQTYRNFEFVIVNDGSTDDTESIALSYKDERIKYLKLAKNKGIVGALNEGITVCTGKYIARIDADDIAFPERIEKQVKFMETNPQIGVLGTNVKYFGDADFDTDMAVDNDRLKAILLFNTPFIHPSVMVRSELFKQVPYSDKFPHLEDYYQWFRLAPITKFANLKEVLLHYREHNSGISKVNSSQKSPHLELLYAEIFSTLNIDFDKNGRNIHLYAKLNFNDDPSGMTREIANWFRTLRVQIKRQKIIPQKQALELIEMQKQRMYYRIARFSKRAALKFIYYDRNWLPSREIYYLLKVKPKPGKK